MIGYRLYRYRNITKNIFSDIKFNNNSTNKLVYITNWKEKNDKKYEIKNKNIDILNTSYSRYITNVNTSHFNASSSSSFSSFNTLNNAVKNSINRYNIYDNGKYSYSKFSMGSSQRNNHKNKKKGFFQKRPWILKFLIFGGLTVSVVYFLTLDHVVFTNRRRNILGFGESILSSLEIPLSEDILPKEHEYYKVLLRIFQRLKKNVPEMENLKVKFLIINDDMFNAFAQPGGTITFTTTVFENANNDTEIASILAHELGHLLAKHTLEQFFYILSLRVLTIYMRDSGSITNSIVNSIEGLLSLKRSRLLEFEADHIGLILMAHAGYNPKVMIDFHERTIAKYFSDNSMSDFLSTHPSSDKRIAQMNKNLEEVTKIYQKKILENRQKYNRKRKR
eukprot:TRINITY_DN13301_c0_g1_i1.p1 TRINITY_DN13301_c0_g1~~TRINITY_DN13301_c0_g1_i1.p1  ORF type:complete len:392 (+),score=67.42 TRINITY_DN13301_c0_g1_i1:95-1270(+)